MRTNPNPPLRHKRALVTCMRNEGIFLLEWVAYHLSIGFDLIFIVTNNCQDGTDLMAEWLSRIEPVIHIANTVIPGEAPQAVGMARVLAHPAMAEVEWLLHIDADEFLNVTTGNGHVEDLLVEVPPSDVIAVAWRYMSSGGRKTWEGGSLIADQRLSSHDPRTIISGHKSFFRPEKFGRAIDHMPKEPKEPNVIVRNTAGDILPSRALFHQNAARYRGMEDSALTWKNADIHHYFVRSEDVFLLKNIRGDGMALLHDKYHLGSRLWQKSEIGTVVDNSIVRHLPRVQSKLNDYADDPMLNQLSQMAEEWFKKQCKTYLTQKNLALWDKRIGAQLEPQ